MHVLRLCSAALPALVLLSVTGAAQTRPVAAPVQVINLQSYAFTPNVIHLRSGKAVTLHFVNSSGTRHDFTAPAFFAAGEILSGPVRDGRVDLRPGRSASVTLIPAAGTYKVRCTRRFHKSLGMHGRILVH